MIHELKTWPVFFEAVWSGAKAFEIRKDDRGFEVGHKIRLQEWNPADQRYTGRAVIADISYIFRGGEFFGASSFGLECGNCIMSLKGMEKRMRLLEQRLTFREKYGPAMVITDKKEADVYLAALVEHNLWVSKNFKGKERTLEQAEVIEKSNLGYFAGYYDEDTRRRVEALFQCVHPVLGAIAETGQLTPREIFQKGFDYATHNRQNG